MTKTLRVAVADDDTDEVFLLRWAFKHAGLTHEIIHLHDGAMTIEYLEGAPPYDDRVRFPMPDLLLLDLKMQKRNGFDVLAWLAARPDINHLPVIVFSASRFPADGELASKLGAKEFLTKPYDLNDLVGMVRGLHDRWLACEEPILPTFTAPEHKSSVSRV